MTSKKITFLIPVKNDYDSVFDLIKEIVKQSQSHASQINFLIIDDGSEINEKNKSESLIKSFSNVHVIYLNRSLGHQSAIYRGLEYLNIELKIMEDHYLVIMDGDGEDIPKHAFLMVSDLEKNSTLNAIVATRGKRMVSWTFKLSYLLFQLFFRMAVGKKIETGNFMAIRIRYLKSLIDLPSARNNLSGTLIRFGTEIQYRKFDRGNRISGKSKMNFTNLVLHAWGMLTVFADRIYIRIFIGSVIWAVFAFLIAIIAVILKLFNVIPTLPGWSSLFVTELAAFSFIIFINLTLSTLILLTIKSGVEKP